MKDIEFGKVGFEWLDKLVQNTHSTFIICDENTIKCLPNLHSRCESTRSLKVMTLAAGEHNKQIGACQEIWQWLTDNGADRQSLVINLGGGVVTDVGGFAASTYLRGIRFVNIPTSLMGMADAAIGGKTGVDMGPVKNRIGLFSRPEGVVIDIDFLSTLPQVELKSGMAEILKCAFIADPCMLPIIEGDLLELVKRSVAVKSRVVAIDPMDRGERRKLNFGHTVGHAIESGFLEKGLPITHGEAVAAGMIIGAHISVVRSGLSASGLRTIIGHVDRIFKRLQLNPELRERILTLMAHDKKNRNGRIQMVLLSELGKAVYDQEITQKQIEHAFDQYEDLI